VTETKNLLDAKQRSNQAKLEMVFPYFPSWLLRCFAALRHKDFFFWTQVGESTKTCFSSLNRLPRC